MPILLICFCGCNVVHFNCAYQGKKILRPFPSAFIHVISISIFHYLLNPNFLPDPHPLCSSILLFIPLSLFHQPIISPSKTISTPPDISLTINEVVE